MMRSSVESGALDGGVKTICVYCGARPGNDPAYIALAKRLGSVAARADLSIIYGGGGAGLMGAVARLVSARVADWAATSSRRHCPSPALFANADRFA